MHKIPEPPVRYQDFDLVLLPGGARRIRRKIAPPTEAACFFRRTTVTSWLLSTPGPLGRLGELAK